MTACVAGTSRGLRRSRLAHGFHQLVAQHVELQHLPQVAGLASLSCNQIESGRIAARAASA